jgi:chromate transporter
MLEVFRVFLLLGLSSFGGPVAHLSYFRKELVERRRWLSETEFADSFALCQFLPGPSSSQVAICAGVYRAGLPGGLAAWVGFSLPSTLLMIAFAYGLRELPAGAWLHGLKLVATAVVAQAVWLMGRQLCPDFPRRALAVLTAAVCLLQPNFLGQVSALLTDALLGFILYRKNTAIPPEVSGIRFPRWLSPAALACFSLLLAASQAYTGLLASFFRVGSMVFGGGHVILPLLQSAVCEPGWVSNDDFLGGYGAAQALPGPLFSFAAYLGTLIGGWRQGCLCLLVLNMPSFLLLLGIVPHWNNWRRQVAWRSALAGVCAAVVGLLLAAFIHPVCSSAIRSPADVLAALLALLLLTRLPVWLVVLLGGLGGWAFGG